MLVNPEGSTDKEAEEVFSYHLLLTTYLYKLRM